MQLQAIPIHTVVFLAAAVACTPEFDDAEAWPEDVEYLPSSEPVIDIDRASPGEHELCATAKHSYASGDEDPTGCTKTYVNREPEARCRDVVVYADESCTADADVDAGSYDPDYGQEFECTADPEGPYPIGTTEVTLTCEDEYGATSTCEAKVKVLDGNPPEIETKTNLGDLWPPNHQYEKFSVYDCLESVKDVCSHDGYYYKYEDKPELELLRVISDEGELAMGSGNTCDDIVIGKHGKFAVRSERVGGGNGRVYRVIFGVKDDYGEFSKHSCTIGVPANNEPDATAIEDDCALCVGYGCAKEQCWSDATCD